MTSFALSRRAAESRARAHSGAPAAAASVGAAEAHGSESEKVSEGGPRPARRAGPQRALLRRAASRPDCFPRSAAFTSALHQLRRSAAGMFEPNGTTEELS